MNNVNWMSNETPLPGPGEPCVNATWGHLKLTIALLEKESVEYVLLGGFAMNLLGFSRYTGDIDILVKVTHENNKRWIKALSQLPDGVASELTELENPFTSEVVNFEDDDQEGVIRIFDAFVVDVMPKACGLIYEDLEEHFIRKTQDGLEFTMLNAEGMMLTKRGVRPKDIQDALWLKTNLSNLMSFSSFKI